MFPKPQSESQERKEIRAIKASVGDVVGGRILILHIHVEAMLNVPNRSVDCVCCHHAGTLMRNGSYDMEA